MTRDLWSACNGKQHLCLLAETAWRLVEAQEITATRKLVDSLEEQIILEDLLEDNKPLITDNHFHYHALLYTPFRYPPLQYGSRFGNKFEPALWYGSLLLNTAFSEKAFYKFNFLRASLADYSLVEEHLTAFSASVKTTHGVDLTKPPFTTHRDKISAPDSYEVSQQLGATMRNEDIQAISYTSARDSQHGTNIALFTPSAFQRKQPNEKSFQSWQSLANKTSIEFVRISAMTLEVKRYSVDEFMVNGVLPFSAN